MIVRFTPTLKDLQDAGWLRVKERRRIMLIGLPLCGLLFLGFAVQEYVANSRIEWFLVGFAVWAFLWKSVLFRLLNMWRVWFLVRRNKQLFCKETEIQIVPEKLLASSENAKSEYEWSKLLGYSNNATTILFYVSRDYAIFIPKRAFADSAAAAECLRLLAAAGLKEI